MTRVQTWQRSATQSILSFPKKRWPLTTTLGTPGHCRRSNSASALLALSPYVQPFLVRGTPAGLGAPVMYHGGTLDFGITPALHRESIRVVSRHAKTRQKQLAVRGAAQLCGARHEARRNAAQPRNDRTRFIEPSHMDIARGENAV